MPEFDSFYYTISSSESNWNGFPLKNLREYLASLPLKQKVLDVGCGTGQVIRYLPEGSTYTGFDASEFAVQQANKLWSAHSGIEFKQQTAAMLPFPDASCSIALMLFSLEHLQNPKQSLAECVRVLRPGGGKLIIFAPNLELPLAWPNGLRHHSTIYRIWFTLLRTCDYLLRCLGVLSFRVLKDNYTSVTGKYEKKDDDLWHMLSAWEVITYLERNGMKLEVFWKERELSGIRRWISKLPMLKWYGMTFAAVFTKL